MAIEDRVAASLSELVEVVLSIRDGLDPAAFLWFRGIDCMHHPLLPKIMREGKSGPQVFERERRLLTRFRQRSMAYWPTGYPQSDWEHLFAMQHYGMPTRLLDWSENVFVAAYFALSTHKDHAHGSVPCAPAIWCVDPVKWNRSMPALSEFEESISVLTTADEEHLDSYRPDTNKRRQKSPVAIFGAHNSERIVAQRGTFIVWGIEPEPLEHYANIAAPALLWRIKLTGLTHELHRDLQSLGFGETMIYPELTYLATELSRAEGWR